MLPCAAAAGKSSSGNRRRPCHNGAMPYLIIHVEDAGSDPYWTLVDAAIGKDLRDRYRFASQQEAEDAANMMSGVEAEEPPSAK